MKKAEDIESLAGRIQFEPDASADQRILSAAEAAFDNRTETGPAVKTRPAWRNTMKNPIAKLAVAAAVMVGALLAIYFYGGTSGIVWADVLDKVMAFDTYVCRTREIETTGPRPDGFEFATESESITYRSETYGSFSENYKNGKLFVRHYTVLKEGLHLSFFGFHEGDKICMRLPLKEENIAEFHEKHPRGIVARILAGEYTELGRDTIEGKPVMGVEIRNPNVFPNEPNKIPPMDDFAARLWVEVQSKLPVWVEISVVLKGSPIRKTIVWDRFEWGVPLEASLFSPEIPADYEIVDAAGTAPDSRPKTAAAEAFAERTLAEPYLGEFDHLAVPDLSDLVLLGAEPNAPRPQVRLLGAEEVRRMQDAVVGGWPRYEDVRAELAAELEEKLAIGAMDVNELVTTAIALRGRFWDQGGCLSEVSYPYAYAARLAAETAHERSPADAAVTDQLVESIITYEVLYYQEADPNGSRLNPIYGGLLTDLRVEQFEQLKARAGEGYVPGWKDFVRCCDLMLLSPKRGDYDTAVEAARFLIDRADTAGWTYYLESLRRAEGYLAVGTRSGTPTFIGSMRDISLDRYQRRLWSFQGPPEYRDSIMPVHMRHLKDR
ncbi:MAG: hypothetical protein JSU94_21900 [Phycisphaerales bacterium]|nr:MAG: hypothetical protein JSU94_21900 [Phycisphaerales bacterium]